MAETSPFIYNNIVVDGPPGVGKTYMVHWLKDILGFPVIRPRPYEHGNQMQTDLHAIARGAEIGPVLAIIENDYEPRSRHGAIFDLTSFPVIQSRHVDPPQSVSEVGYGPNVLVISIVAHAMQSKIAEDAGLPVFSVSHRGDFEKRNMDFVDSLQKIETLSDEWKTGLNSAHEVAASALRDAAVD
jgi:hypothetical protein